MSTTQNDGGPAFACDAGDGNGQRGMSLLDWMAGMAMQGILANPASYDANGNWRNEHETVAEVAYDIAGDMIKERNSSHE